MTEVSQATRAALIPFEWPLPVPGMGLPEGWGVYPMGPGISRPTVPPLNMRCEAAVLRHQTICRCLRTRNHDGGHMVHP